MNRILVALVLLQALVIAFLALQLSERVEDGGLTPMRDGVDASVDEGANRNGAPRRPGTVTTDPAARADSVPASAPAHREPPLEPNDPIGTIVIGSISRSDGAPLGQKPAVYFLDDRTGTNLDVNIKESAYSAVGIQPGSYTLWVRCGACRDFQKTVEIRPSSAPQRFDVVLETAIVVRLTFNTPDGKPLRQEIADRLKARDLEITAIATAAPPPRMIAATSSRYLTDFGIGRYRAARDGSVANRDAPKADALIEIQGPLPAYVSAVMRCSVLDTKLVSEPIESLTFSIPWEIILGAMASLKAIVVDADTGEPIATAKAALNDRQTGGGGTKVGEDGSVHFEYVRSGLLVLEISAQGYATSSRYLRFEPGKALDLGRIALSKGRSLAGIVLGPEGKPVAASIRWRNLDEIDSPQDFDIGWAPQASDDGAFKIDPVGRGRILVMASYPLEKPTAAATLIVDTQVGSADGMRIELQPLHEITFDITIAPDRICLLQVIDSSGRIWWTRNVWSSRPHWTRLPTGDYTLEIYEDSRLRKSMPLAVRSEGQRLKVEP